MVARLGMQLLVACAFSLCVWACADTQTAKEHAASTEEELQASNQTATARAKELAIKDTARQDEVPAPTKEEFAAGNAAYRWLYADGGPSGYDRFSSGVIRSQAVLDAFIVREDLRLLMQPFYSALDSARIDFSKEALVLQTAIAKWRYKTDGRAIDILPACTVYTFVVDI